MPNSYKKGFLVCVLAAYLIYVLWFALDAGHLVYWGWAAVLFVAAMGAAFEKFWVEYMVHTIALTTILGWCYVVWGLYFSGWPFTDFTSTFIALMPALLTFIICIVSSWFAYSIFHPKTADN